LCHWFLMLGIDAEYEIFVFLGLTFLNTMISNSIHFLVTEFHSYLWLNNTPLCFKYHNFFIHSLLSWFHSLAIVNSTVVNMSVQVSLFYIELHFFWYMPTSLFSRIIWQFCF
jgi:hypothetical protein